MLPDFRFVLGAFLAVSVLFVTGVGLVASARLVHEAHMAPIEEARSLAYAGHPEWNQFYDPDHPRRITVPVPNEEGETAPTVKLNEATARIEPLPAPVMAPARSTTEPPAQATEEKPLDPALLDPQPTAGAPALIAAPRQASPAAGEAPAADTAPPREQVANTPLPSGGAESPDAANNSETKSADPATEAPVQPQASGDVTPDTVWPPLPPRPKPHPRRRIVRSRFRSLAQQNQQPFQQPFQQSWQNPGFPTNNSSWNANDNPFAPTTNKKLAGKLATPRNRPQ